MNKIVTVLLIPTIAKAAYIPSIQNPSGNDRYRTQSGASCEQAVATGKSFQVGVYGNDQEYGDNTWGGQTTGELGIYAGLQYQFGGEKRIDCRRMYDIAIGEMTRQDKLDQAKFELEMMQIDREKERLLHPAVFVEPPKPKPKPTPDPKPKIETKTPAVTPPRQPLKPSSGIGKLNFKEFIYESD
ncbi:hypothetical protein [Vibrio sp.]|uniref:hypothetical protein n=1 Tax=Vibrio sp. TaxID=678 RepID=UPI0037A42DDF